MTAQPPKAEQPLDEWLQPIVLSPKPYLLFVRSLNQSLAELEQREGVRPPFSQERHSHGLPRKAK